MRAALIGPNQTASIATATWTALLPADKHRRFLAFQNTTGVDLYWQLATSAPADTTAAFILPNGERIFFDAESIPVSPIYVYHTAGVAKSVQYLEG